MDTAERSTAKEAATFDRFISYSHAADGLRAARPPVGPPALRQPWWKRQAVRIFRDESPSRPTPTCGLQSPGRRLIGVVRPPLPRRRLPPGQTGNQILDHPQRSLPDPPRIQGRRLRLSSQAPLRCRAWRTFPGCFDRSSRQTCHSQVEGGAAEPIVEVIWKEPPRLGARRQRGDHDHGDRSHQHDDLGSHCHVLLYCRRRMASWSRAEDRGQQLQIPCSGHGNDRHWSGSRSRRADRRPKRSLLARIRFPPLSPRQPHP
jgi:hypothetical protein